MADLISREALLALLEERRNFLFKENGDYDHYANGFDEAVDKVEYFPAVDAVPVVRCRDCIYRDKSYVNGQGFRICPASGMDITDTDFCSYGEREENG